MCMTVFLHAPICAPPVYLVPAEARRRLLDPWNWSHQQLCATMWVLGTEPVSYARAASTVNH